VDWRLSPTDLLTLKLQWARKVVHSAQHLEARFRLDAGEGDASKMS